MLVHDPTPIPQTDLIGVLERQIAQRTWRRIHRLRVERVNGRLVVQGWTSSYYVKQLALLAVREVFEAASMPLDCEVDLEVGASDPRAPQPTPPSVSAHDG